MKEKIRAKVRFIPKAKTFEEWQTENEILLAGEHGVVIDKSGLKREKIGDGVTPWNELAWWNGASAYEVAVINGFKGTEKEWLDSLKGDRGEKGEKGDKGDSVANSCVEAVADTVSQRDANGALFSALKIESPVGYDYPFPIQKSVKALTSVNASEEKKIVKWDGTVATSFAEGKGSEDEPYIIYTPSELALVASSSNYEECYFKIADGIYAFDMNGINGITLCSDIDDVKTAQKLNNWALTVNNGKTFANGWKDCFSGHFDGNGVIIFNLYCKDTCAALFPMVWKYPSVENLTVKNSYFESTVAVDVNNGGCGAFMGCHTNVNGYNSKHIKIDRCCLLNCYIKGAEKAGLIAGQLRFMYLDLCNCLISDNELDVEETSQTNALFGNSNLTNESNIVKNCIVCDIDISGNYSCDNSYGTNDAGGCTKIEKDALVEKDIYKTVKFDWLNNWMIPNDYCSANATADYVENRLREVEDVISTETNTLFSECKDDISGLFSNHSALTSIINAKKITTHGMLVGGTYTFDWNAFYVFKSNSGDADLKFVDSDGNQITSYSYAYGVILLPEESYYDEKRVSQLHGLIAGYTNKSTLITTDKIQMLQFDIAPNKKISVTPTAESMIIYKIAF